MSLPGRKVEHRRPATYADVVAAPEHLVAELVDGELYTSPRPLPRHGWASVQLSSTLSGPFWFRGGNGPGGWIFLPEPQLHLDDAVLVPDLAGWRRERLPKLPDEVGITVAPDWVCEVLSPSTGRLDRSKKLPVYARAGIPHAWLVDPLEKTLEVFRLQNGAWVLALAAGEDDRVRAEPFDAIELDLTVLWAD